MNLKKIDLHPSNDFETTTEHFKIKLRTIYPTELKEKKKAGSKETYRLKASYQ